MWLTLSQRCSQLSVAIIKQWQSSQKSSQTSQWLLTVAMCQCLHDLILVQHSTPSTTEFSFNVCTSVITWKECTLLVWELPSWTVPGGNVRRDNCTSYNGCTCCSTRIDSRTGTIYYVHADIMCIVNGHQLMCICYADDIQEYFQMKVGKITVVKGMVEDCISHVHRWLASNRLRLNLDKTEVMWCSSRGRAGTFD